MVKKEKKVNEKKSKSKNIKLDVSKLSLYVKGEKEVKVDNKIKELGEKNNKKDWEGLENNLDNILSFSEGGMTQRLGVGVFREGINPVRNLEQDIGAAESGTETGNENLKKVDEKNIGYVTNSGAYTLTPMIGEEDNLKGQRRGGDDAGRVLTAKRIEFGGRETGSAGRPINVEEFQRNMQGGAGGNGDYGDYAPVAKREYESNLPFEQREKKRRF